MTRTVDNILTAVVKDQMTPEEGMDAIAAVEALDPSRFALDCYRGMDLLLKCMEATRQPKPWQPQNEFDHLNPEDLRD